MKRIIFLVLCLVLLTGLAMPAMAADNVPQVKAVVQRRDGEVRELWLFDYNSKGQLSEVDVWGFYSSEATNFQITLAYDKNGNPKTITQDWGEGTADEYRYTHSYNSKKQIVKTAGKLVAVSATEDDYIIWEDTTTYKYDSNKRMSQKARDYYGTTITTKYFYEHDNYVTVTEKAVDGGEVVNYNESYYMNGYTPWRILYNDDGEYTISPELLEGIMGIYLEDCRFTYDRQGRVETIREAYDKDSVEIIYQ